MAQQAGVSQWQVRKVWDAADLKPHRIKSFKISNDPDFAEKVIDVVGLYLDPPDNAVVLSVDEETQIQALDGTRRCCPCDPCAPADGAAVPGSWPRPRSSGDRSGPLVGVTGLIAQDLTLSQDLNLADAAPHLDAAPDPTKGTA